MSDYYMEFDFLRGQMASTLGGNSEQLVYVLTEAFCSADFEDVIESGQLGEGVEKDRAINRLRAIADAIEEGAIT